MKAGALPGRLGNFFVELTSECKCGAWAYSRAKLVYQPLTPDQLTGMWVMAEVALPDDWRLDRKGTPHCPICAGVTTEKK